MSDNKGPTLHTRLQEAEIRKLESEAAAYQAEMEKNLSEAEHYNLMSRGLKHDLDDADFSDEHNFVYNFWSGVDVESVKKCIKSLSNWARKNPGAPITISFNSPGGGVFPGLALYDFIQTLKQNNHYITTVGYGMSASMGSVLLQAGNTRLIGPNTYVMVHEVSSVGIGKVSELQDEAALCKRLNQQLVAILAERSTKTAKEIERASKRKDVWLDANDALEWGFVDGIILGGNSSAA